MLRKKLLLFFVTLTFAVSVISPTLNQKVHAADGSKWMAGRIIDDVVFTDSGSMSVQDIQNFLNSKVGTGGYGRSGWPMRHMGCWHF
jgi:hypothetical protein